MGGRIEEGSPFLQRSSFHKGRSGFAGQRSTLKEGLPGWCLGIVSAWAESGLPFSSPFKEACSSPGYFPGVFFLWWVVFVVVLCYSRAGLVESDCIFTLKCSNLQQPCHGDVLPKSVRVLVRVLVCTCACVPVYAHKFR